MKLVEVRERTLAILIFAAAVSGSLLAHRIRTMPVEAIPAVALEVDEASVAPVSAVVDVEAARQGTWLTQYYAGEPYAIFIGETPEGVVIKNNVFAGSTHPTRKKR